MCPICWISGFIAVLFGGSFIATVNHPISWVLGFALIIYSIYKFYEAKKRGKKMTKETKQRNKKTIFRFELSTYSFVYVYHINLQIYIRQ